jgi:hypothetical protein
VSALALLRQTVLSNLRQTAEELLVDPDPTVRTPAEVEALQQVFQGYEYLVRATSSSSPGYEFRDLQVTEAREWKQTAHILRLLDEVYVEPTRPKAAP